MASYNKVILLGNLTRDPQLKYLPSQTPVVEFGIATNRKYKTQSGEMKEEVTFIDCSAFGRTAEVINQYCHKGNLLFVEGRLKYDTWEDKQGGGKRSKVNVHVENMQLMPNRDGRGGGPPAEESGGDEEQRPAPSRSAARPAPRAEAPISE